MRARGLSAILLGIGVGWGAGNIGPVVEPLSRDFHVTLAGVGLLSGTVYFAAVMIATPFAVPLAARVGIVRAGAIAAAFVASSRPTTVTFALGITPPLGSATVTSSLVSRRALLCP